MLWRLLGHFSYDKQAGIALTTALSILSLILLIYTGLDLARYHMINRGLSSAAQQTVEWMANRGASATEDPNVLTRDAIVGRMGKNIIPSTALYSGITSVTTTFSYDGPTGVSRLIVKANYNLMLRKTFNLQPLAMSADARIKLNPVFVSIVFSSGEMRSEGNDIYGQGLSGTAQANRGVSWTSPYYTGVINQTVGTRSTPTHNYYMAAALAKELAGKFQFRKHYMNIIPVSATINLNPLDYSATPTGTKEKKLPLWIYADSGFLYDNTSNAAPTDAICITNRTFSNERDNVGYQQDYYRVNTSELGTTLPIYTNNWFNHDQLLLDSSLKFVIEGSQAGGSPNWLGPRGYPYSPISGGRCPAKNGTPALASFHELTTNDYTPDSRSKTSPTENENFWDYMRNYIDPAKVSNFPIWGSPNMVFGLQIAFENIADVQKFKRINNNNNNAYDPTSEFFVYMVSDQIGGVKNAGGANATSSPQSSTRYANFNRCMDIDDWLPPQLFLCIDDSARTTGFEYKLPANTSSGASSVDFQFTHFWWDNYYNAVTTGCMAFPIYYTFSCNINYSAHPEVVVHNFYNIINYAIDLKYNKDQKFNFKRPKVFFVDTGSGKINDECAASNSYSSLYEIQNPNLPQHTEQYAYYAKSKPCLAYAEMAGYNVTYPTKWPFILSINLAKDFGNIFHPDGSEAPTTYEGAIENMYLSIAPFPYNDEWINTRDTKRNGSLVDASGFDKVFAYKYVQSGATTRNLDTLAAKNLPIDYYNSNYKLQVRSNSKSSAAYDNSVNNATNAANIAKYVVQQSLLAPPILRPY